MYQNVVGRKGHVFAPESASSDHPPREAWTGAWPIQLYDAAMPNSPRPGFMASARAAWGRLRGGKLDPRRASASVAVGAFVTCLPLYGLQTPLCALLTVPLHLDFALAWAVTLLANPVTAPLLALAEVELGSWLCHGRGVALPTRWNAPRELLPYAPLLAVGSFALGLIMAGAGGALTYGLTQRMARRRAAAHSTTRTEST
jgi:uncharacterized protein (DUF2062 family)